MLPNDVLSDMMRQIIELADNYRDLQDMFLWDPDRAERMLSAAENGCDGSTHYETIEDWRRVLSDLTIIDDDDDDASDISAGIIRQEDYDALSEEIDSVEKWHYRNGTLHDEIG